MKKPFVTKEQLEEIVKKYPTPFHLYDEKGMRENARRVNAAFSWNGGFKEYFAVKATPTPALLKILRQEGCGADCSSMTELMMAEKCGFKGHEIMFSSNNTLAEEFRLADQLGAIINLDDLTMWTSWRSPWEAGCRRRCSAATTLAGCSPWGRARRASR